MPTSQFQGKLARLNAYATNDVTGAFTDAQTELGNISAPTVQYLELFYDGSKICRAWDGEKVDTLPLSEQLRLYPQLDGLFKKAAFVVSMP